MSHFITDPYLALFAICVLMAVGLWIRLFKWAKEASYSKSVAINKSYVLSPAMEAKNKVLHAIDKSKSYAEVCVCERLVDEFVAAYHLDVDEKVWVKLYDRLDAKKKIINAWDKRNVRANPFSLPELRYGHE